MGKPGMRFSISFRMSKRRGRHQDALGVSRALLGLELVGAVRGADRDGQRIHARLLHEVFHVGGVGVVRVLGSHFVFDAGQHAQLAFDRYVVLMSVFHHFLRQRHVFVIGQCRTVDHHRRETHVDAVLAQLERVAVVEVQYDGNVLAQFLGVLHSALCHVAQQRLVGVLARACRHLQDDGRRGLDACLDDGLHLLHVVEVEGRNGVAALDGLGEHVAGVHQTQFLVRYHNRLLFSSESFLLSSLSPARYGLGKKKIRTQKSHKFN